MVQPVTTTDLLLQEISETLSEVRDLLQRQGEHVASAGKAAAEQPAKKTASKRSPAKSVAAKRRS